MKIKKLLRFYFSAGSLNKALDNIILRAAVSAGADVYSGCEKFAEKIAAVIEDKAKLSNLWARLNAVLAAMTEKDRLTLKRYAAARQGNGGGEQKEIHRAVVKFSRRASGLLNGAEEEYKILCAYRCLLSSEPD